ncbi:hypothetical protein D3C71_688620 [compost metagenome]
MDDDTLTEGEWQVMFSGPEWSEAVLEEMSKSLRGAYKLHLEAIRSAFLPDPKTEDQ